MKFLDLIKKNYLLFALVITIIVFGIVSEGKLFSSKTYWEVHSFLDKKARALK